MPLDPLTGLYPDAPAPTLVKETKYVYIQPPTPPLAALDSGPIVGEFYFSAGANSGTYSNAITTFDTASGGTATLVYIEYVGFATFYS